MSMADIMRRLMTGYSVWHNRRHQRDGHLFQNRYKSIIVDENPYFVELLRYIHLNPVRGNLLTDIRQLDSNPYTGHAVILGKRQFEGQEVDWVLSWFGDRIGHARRNYRAFVKAEFDQGGREELRGGGLIRSAGGRKHLAARKKEEWELGDDRILGNGSFVKKILYECETYRTSQKGDAQTILSEVSSALQISEDLILSKSRVRRVSAARRLFFLRAHEEAGATYTELGRLCGIEHTSVREAVAKARSEKEK